MAQSGSYPPIEFNFATQGLRQPGSTFKAIVLADALSRGIDPFTTDYLSHTLPPGWLTGYPTYTVSIDGGGNLERAAESGRGAGRLRQHGVRAARRRPRRAERHRDGLQARRHDPSRQLTRPRRSAA